MEKVHVISGIEDVNLITQNGFELIGVIDAIGTIANIGYQIAVNLSDIFLNYDDNSKVENPSINSVVYGISNIEMVSQTSISEITYETTTIEKVKNIINNDKSYNINNVEKIYGNN